MEEQAIDAKLQRGPDLTGTGIGFLPCFDEYSKYNWTILLKIEITNM